MGGAASFNRKAGFDVALRFAPELLPGAEFTEGEEQLRVVRISFQPRLRAFDLGKRFFRRDVGIEQGEIGIPLIGQGALDDVLRIFAHVKFRKGARAGAG